MMSIYQTISVATVLALLSFSATADSTSDKMKAMYFSSLDNWVGDGGNIETIQGSVVEYCGKLVMMFASNLDRIAFTTTARDEFDFRVDVCTKMTINRVHPQPEFEKPKIISLVCDGEVDLFNVMCQRIGLR